MYCHTFWDVHSCLYGVNVYLHTSCVFIFFSIWFCLESQSAMKRSGQVVYYSDSVLVYFEEHFL